MNQSCGRELGVVRKLVRLRFAFNPFSARKRHKIDDVIGVASTVLISPLQERKTWHLHETSASGVQSDVLLPLSLTLCEVCNNTKRKPVRQLKKTIAFFHELSRLSPLLVRERKREKWRQRRERIRWSQLQPRSRRPKTCRISPS